nr:hypothetical protein [Tanacetum cinerariifolium]
MLRLCHWLIACSIAERSQAPEKVTVTDLFYLRGMDVGSVNIPYLLARVEEDVHEIRGAQQEQRGVVDSMACDFSRFSTWKVVGLSQMMSQDGVKYTSYADFHISYVRRTRVRIDDASTSTA